MGRAIPILPVTDLRVARAFYVERLGFGVRFDAGAADGTGLLGVERDGMCLTLDCPMSGHGRDACVGLEVDDADALHAEWSACVEISQAPRDEPWGARTFGVTDPFGNTLFVMGPPRGA